jgi:hypothetical protein
VTSALVGVDTFRSPESGDVTTSTAARPVTGRNRTFPAWLLLLAILVFQAALSARLLRSDTAFGDEALYLYAGHLEWAYWLHGYNSVYRVAFPSWFSGSPVIYPPLGAIADSLGGLLGARLLSLGFMLGATTCLYGVASRLLDRRAGLFAAFIFVMIAPTQDLGAFATYDAMALSLLAFATWIGVVAAGLRIGPRVVLLAASGAVIVLADATKYATTLWTPAAILVIATAGWQARGFRTGLYAGATVFGAWIAALAGALAWGGRVYWRGILQTTLARSTSNAPASAVLHQSFTLIGLVLILAIFGAIASIGADARTRVLCCTAVFAVLLAPLNQARIHTTVSLHKHVDFGAWFAAIAAGYLLSRVSKIDARRGWCAAVIAIITVPGLLGSFGEAGLWANYWPNTTKMLADLRPLAKPTGGPYLFEEFDVGYYYLHDDVYPGQLQNMFGFIYWDQRKHVLLSGPAAFRLAIANHYFNLIEVDGQNIPPATTKAIEHSLAHTRGYRLVFKQQWGPSRSAGLSHGYIEIWRLLALRGKAS